MKRLRLFFINSNNVKRDSYIWNMLSATLFAVQSAIVLMVVTRTNGLDDAGIFSIAYAVASLMYYIGEYGVRKYQVSDINEEMTFTDYHAHRIVSCAIATAATLIYTAYVLIIKGYSWEKAYIVFAICMVKVIEAYSEVYFGRYQQVGRLDVAAKTNFYRIAVGLVVYITMLVATRDMELSVTAWMIASLYALITSSVLVYRDFGTLKKIFDRKKITRIFSECFPVFIGYFSLLYVGNTPKYAIDACMSDTDQAIYNFIFMPVFAIGMFANFVFNPILVDLAHKWEDEKIKDFTLIILKQIVVISLITLMALMVALTFGATILGILFNSNLSDYKADLAILMIGGGMLALVNFFAVVVTVMRDQKYLIIGYITVATIAFLMSARVVESHGIRGASVLYTILMAAQALIFAIITFVMIHREVKKNGLIISC